MITQPQAQHVIVEVEQYDFFIAQSEERIRQIQRDVGAKKQRRDELFNSLSPEDQEKVRNPETQGSSTAP